MRNSLRRAALLGLLVPALGFGLQSTAFASEISDPTLDVVDDDGMSLIAPAADITSVDVSKFADRLEMRYRVQGFAGDPLTDKNWTSDETYATFDLDTTKDGEADYSAEYGVLDGRLYVDVRKIDGSEEPPVICKGEPGYLNNTVSAIVPLSCLGNPRDIAFQLSVVYDTDAASESSKVAYDYAPDDEMADAS